MRIKVSDILNYDRIVTKVAEAESYRKMLGQAEVMEFTFENDIGEHGEIYESIEEVSIRDGKVNIHYIDKNRIEHDGCFSLKEEIGQTVLEEFKYNILYDIEYSGLVDKIKFTMEIRD